MVKFTQLNTFHKLFICWRWFHLQYLVGFARLGHWHHLKAIASHPAWPLLVNTGSLYAESIQWNPMSPFLITTSSAYHNFPSCSKTLTDLHIVYFLYYLKIHANRTFLYVKWTRKYCWCYFTNLGVFTHFRMWANRNLLVIKTDNNCDKNKDIILK